MTIDDQIRDEKKKKQKKNDINREAAKIFALSLTNLINVNILQEKKYYHLIKNK